MHSLPLYQWTSCGHGILLRYSMGVLADRTVLGSIRVYSKALENQYLSSYPPNVLMQLASANSGAVHKSA